MLATARPRSARAALPMRAAARAAVLLPAAALLLLTPRPAAAQDGFMFGPPEAGLTVRIGGMMYTGGGDIFQTLRQDLTLKRGDFRAPAAGFDVVIMGLPRFDVTLGAGVAHASARSEFRDWVDQDEQPIEQRTALISAPVTVTLRYLPLSRGRSISSVAWLPRSTTPYVGAGGGAVWYRLRQTGDFVDHVDLSIFSDTIEASGWNVVLHGVAGLDHWLTPRLGLNAEARYNHGGAPGREDFQSFDRLDIGGFQATLGFSVRW